jgi:hypothetical protein
MKKVLSGVLILLILTAIILTLTACTSCMSCTSCLGGDKNNGGGDNGGDGGGDNTQTTINLTFDGFNSYGNFDNYKRVSSSTTTFSFEGVIQASEGVTWIVSTDEAGQQTVSKTAASLEKGNNTFYVIASTTKGAKRTYTLVIKRNNSYTVTFKGWHNGPVLYTKQVEEGDLVTADGIDTVRAGYTFNMWNYSFAEAITSDKEIYALWDAIKCSITLNPGIGSFGKPGDQSQVRYSGDPVELPRARHDTKGFLGWYTAETDGDKIADGNGQSTEPWISPGEKVTLYARWSEYKRINALGNESMTGEYVLFGEYPQTLKAVGVTVYETQDARGYYSASDGAYYAKVGINPHTYPYEGYMFSDGITPVVKNNTYYFKVEPIKWRILSEGAGGARLICENILDFHIFNEVYEGQNAEGAYANNYKTSGIREWLNNEFYSKAFNTTQRQLAVKLLVDNSAASTKDDPNPYACANTADFIFLPSYREVVNTEYGFNESEKEKDTLRKRLTSDYSRARGVYMNSDSASADYGNGRWYTRSPISTSHARVSAVETDGALFGSTGWIHYDGYGVVPAMAIRLGN